MAAKEGNASTDSLNQLGRQRSQGTLFMNVSGSEETLDRLKCLKYVREFCKPNRIPPFHKFYFMTPANNPNEQFYHFALLVSWLTKFTKAPMEAPAQFDDPNAVAAVLKKLGIVFDYGPTKIRQGHGEAVLYVIQSLTDLAFTNTKFIFKQPIHKAEEYPDEAEVDDAAEIVADEDHGSDEEDSPVVVVSKKQEKVVETKVDPNEWRLEVERVTPMLRVQIPNDNKDWRIHLEHINVHKQAIGSTLTETQTQLNKLHGEIEKTLEKISSREKYINTQFEHQIENYRTIQDSLSDLKQKYGVANTSVNELTNELARISDELDGVKSRMDELGSGMTDSKPLVNVKQAVTKLKVDIKQMNLRVGVIEHTLLHAKMKTKGTGNNLDATSFSTFDLHQ